VAALTAWAYLYATAGAYISTALVCTLTAPFALYTTKKPRRKLHNPVHAAKPGAAPFTIYPSIRHAKPYPENLARYIDDAGKRLRITAQTYATTPAVTGWGERKRQRWAPEVAATVSLRLSQGNGLVE
jgi:hypothetical protein